MKTNAGSFRFNYDLHGASGLWVWAMLFVFAWSGVAFNLESQVYNPVMEETQRAEAFRVPASRHYRRTR